jgi:hypothetical protein
MHRLRGCGTVLILAVALGATPAPGQEGGIPVEPLVIRVADSIGAPGQQTAIVFRTYASRPVRRGRLSLIAGPVAAPLGSSPFSSVDGGIVFSEEGNVIGTLTYDDATGTFVADFESSGATINRDDGVFAVLYATIGAGSQPGNTWALTLESDPLETFLSDPEDDDHAIEIRSGEIFVRAPGDDYEFEVDGGKVHPGSGATFELGTAEPFAIASGRIVLDYDPTKFAGLPTVSTDPRHGAVSVTISHPQSGRVQLDFTSAGGTLNTVPGDLFRLDIRTPSTIPVGTVTPLTLVAAQSFLVAPVEGATLPVDWVSDQLEFETDITVFSDGFETGDPWVWSRSFEP